MKAKASSMKNATVKDIKPALLDEALTILEEDKTTCRKIGENGFEILKGFDTLLTHCNAGGLATSEYGTALAPIYVGKERGKVFNVYADETRPLLQGARITSYELLAAGIPVTLICDNMAAAVMAMNRIDAVIVGADRIASNGDTANKIGTYGLALIAKAHNVPFFVAAPFSTFDLSIESGKQIPIEQRSANEIINGFGKPTAPSNVPVFNPAFDVTPHELITAIITERGVLYPPFERSINESLIINPQ
jgi:methylthioribose-1-phosphate isomerase